MKSSAVAAAFLLAFSPALEAPYRVALPGYHYEFPRDFFAHPEFQTEWWYTTGNLKASDGHRFGFELTFFRQAVSREESRPSAWDVRDLYLAHLALSDLDDGHFYHSERINRAGPGLAGASAQDGRVWNGNWSATWSKNGMQRLSAEGDDFQFSLALQSEKPPVIHGEKGVSQKSEGLGHASHYFSQTRLLTNGTIGLRGKQFVVSGLSWMDHEFFTHQLSAKQSGWDWFSIQLEDKTELMLFVLRHKDETIDPFSAGTYVDASGKSLHLRAADFSLQPQGALWTSPLTGAAYPIQWKVSVPKLGLLLDAKTKLPQQELAGRTKFAPRYWEGAMEFSGTRSNAAMHGVGYLEMTGYDHPLQMDQ